MSVYEKIERLQVAKDATIAVLTEKGVNVPEGAGFEDFPELTGSIQTGGGNDKLDELLSGQTAELVSNVESIVDYCFYNNKTIASLNLPNCTTIGNSAFAYFSKLKIANIPNVTKLDIRAFWNSQIETVYAPKLEYVGSQAFYGTNITEIPNANKITTLTDSAFEKTKIVRANLPELVTLGASVFNSITTLISADFGENHRSSGLPGVRSSLFYGCTALETVILRAPVLLAMQNVNAFQNTPIANGTGYVYVPKALIEDYKVATNWITYAEQLRAIEDYPEICGGAEND